MTGLVQVMALDIGTRWDGPTSGDGSSGAAGTAARTDRGWDSRRQITRRDVMTAAEVAQLLALPKSTVYELARRGELPCARLGRTMRFLREDIERRLRGL